MNRLLIQHYSQHGGKSLPLIEFQSRQQQLKRYSWQSGEVVGMSRLSHQVHATISRTRHNCWLLDTLSANMCGHRAEWHRMILKTSLTNANLKAFTRLSKLNNKVIFFELTNNIRLPKLKKEHNSKVGEEWKREHSHGSYFYKNLALKKSQGLPTSEKKNDCMCGLVGLGIFKNTKQSSRLEQLKISD